MISQISFSNTRRPNILSQIAVALLICQLPLSITYSQDQASEAQSKNEISLLQEAANIVLETAWRDLTRSHMGITYLSVPGSGGGWANVRNTIREEVLIENSEQKKRQNQLAKLNLETPKVNLDFSSIVNDSERLKELWETLDHYFRLAERNTQNETVSETAPNFYGVRSAAVAALRALEITGFSPLMRLNLKTEASPNAQFEYKMYLAQNGALTTDELQSEAQTLVDYAQSIRNGDLDGAKDQEARAHTAIEILKVAKTKSDDLRHELDQSLLVALTTMIHGKKRVQLYEDLDGQLSSSIRVPDWSKDTYKVFGTINRRFVENPARALVRALGERQFDPAYPFLQGLLFGAGRRFDPAPGSIDARTYHLPLRDITKAMYEIRPEFSTVSDLIRKLRDVAAILQSERHKLYFKVVYLDGHILETADYMTDTSHVDALKKWHSTHMPEHRTHLDMQNESGRGVRPDNSDEFYENEREGRLAANAEYLEQLRRIEIRIEATRRLATSCNTVLLRRQN